MSPLGLWGVARHDVEQAAAVLEGVMSSVTSSGSVRGCHVISDVISAAAVLEGVMSSVTSSAPPHSPGWRVTMSSKPLGPVKILLLTVQSLRRVRQVPSWLDHAAKGPAVTHESRPVEAQLGRSRPVRTKVSESDDSTSCKISILGRELFPLQNLDRWETFF